MTERPILSDDSQTQLNLRSEYIARRLKERGTVSNDELLAQLERLRSEFQSRSRRNKAGRPRKRDAAIYFAVAEVLPSMNGNVVAACRAVLNQDAAYKSKFKNVANFRAAYLRSKKDVEVSGVLRKQT